MACVATRLRLSNLAIFLTIFPERVRANRLANRGAIAAPPAAIIVSVINQTCSEGLRAIYRAVRRNLTYVTIFHAMSRIRVDRPTFFRTFLSARVRRNFLLAIVSSNNANVVTLPIMDASFLRRVNQRILRNRLYVVPGRFLTIGRSFLSFLTVSFSNSIFFRLHAQRLSCRFLRDEAKECAVDPNVMGGDVNFRFRLYRTNHRFNDLRRRNVNLRLRHSRDRFLKK